MMDLVILIVSVVVVSLIVYFLIENYEASLFVKKSNLEINQLKLIRSLTGTVSGDSVSFSIGEEDRLSGYRYFYNSNYLYFDGSGDWVDDSAEIFTFEIYKSDVLFAISGNRRHM